MDGSKKTQNPGGGFFFALPPKRYIKPLWKGCVTRRECIFAANSEGESNKNKSNFIGGSSAPLREKRGRAVDVETGDTVAVLPAPHVDEMLMFCPRSGHKLNFILFGYVLVKKNPIEYVSMNVESGVQIMIMYKRMYL